MSTKRPSILSTGGLRWQATESEAKLPQASTSQNAWSIDDSESESHLSPDPPQLSPFTLRSCFGASCGASAVSASLIGRPAVLYAASHACVLLSAQTPRDSQLLQGHNNTVTALAADATGRWVATGDAGIDNALIVWDTNLCVPVLSLFEWSAEGCRLLALSPNARLLVAVSDATSPQVAVFQWTLGPDKPDATSTLEEFGRPSHLSIGENLELAVTSPSGVAFLAQCADATGGLRTQLPDLPRPAGGRCARLVASAFVPCRATEPGLRLAMTATARGTVVVWAEVDGEWTFFKEVQAQRDAITALLISPNGVVITGNAKGQLRFYDAQLRILYWWQGFTLDSVTSLGFHACAPEDASSDMPGFTHALATMTPAGTCAQQLGVSAQPQQRHGSGPIPGSDVALGGATSLPGLADHTACYTPGVTASCPRMRSPSIGQGTSPAHSGSDVGVPPNAQRSLSLASPLDTLDEWASRPWATDADDEPVPVPSDATLQRKPFLLDDLLVCSLNGDIGVVSVASSRYQRLVVGGVAVTALDAHPEKTQLATGSCSGELRVFDYSARGELLVRETLGGAGGGVTALRFAPSGLLLVAGREDGSLSLVEPITLQLIVELRHLADAPAVRLLEFAPDSQSIALVDDSMALSLWKHQVSITPEDGGSSKESTVSKETKAKGETRSGAVKEGDGDEVDAKEGRGVAGGNEGQDTAGWKHAGKLRAHYKRVVSLLFSPDGLRILTLAEDRAMAECGVSGGPQAGLHLAGLERVEQTAVPCAMLWAPRLRTAEPLLLVSNSELKFKTVSDATRMCNSTVLAPDLGSPVRHMRLATATPKSAPSHKTALLVVAGDRQLGLQLLPSDGNPFKCVSIIGHPEQLTQMCLSNDSQHVFTIGRDDPCVLQWQINPRAVEVSARMGGPGLAPFFALLPGGPDGWLLQEMQDLFIYAQLLHQGESTPAPRRLSDALPVCELPDLMRALGFFPSEYEIENLLHEVSLGPAGAVPPTNGQSPETERVKFADFVRLFVNHRPAVGLGTDRLRTAFGTYADVRSFSMRREALFTALTDYGEGLSRDQVLKYLSVLMRNPRKRVADDDLESFYSRLSPEMTFAQFRDDVLGIIYQLPASALATASTPTQVEATAATQTMGGATSQMPARGGLPPSSP